ncbi:MAG: glucose-6-phosphate isomerase [Bacteroidales bacterium]
MNRLNHPVEVDLNGASRFFDNGELEIFRQKAAKACETLLGGEGRGSDYLGWVKLPSESDPALFERCYNIAREWKGRADVVVVIGIGGSYLGTKAASEALSHNFKHYRGKGEWPDLLFAGQNLSGEYMAELLDILKERDFAVIVISKSGTTTEPAVAFRIIKNLLENRYSKEEAVKRIVAVTDKSRGALKTLAGKEGYRTFVIPDDVGGRYSVLTPVGLMPLAAGGYDIVSLIEGAADMEKVCLSGLEGNPAIEYAAARNLLYSKGKKIEILVNYNPKLLYFSEWWKQLFGESEGKEGRGIYPASVNFTSDLHSMGQYIQEGERTLFETVIDVKKSKREISITDDKENLDGLNFIAGKEVEECNKMARLGTMIAHIDGGVPNLTVSVPEINAYYLGALFYFFEFSCGISAYMLDINPFDQPGVEDYKKNMFALLGKPGFEELAQSLRKRVQ